MTIYAGYGRFNPGELRTVSADFIDRLMRECHNEAVEQCALVAEWLETPEGAKSEDSIAAAIRALKSDK